MNVRDEILDHGRRSKREAARLIGCKYSTLANWLNGGQVAGPEVTSKVAEFLKIREAEVPKQLSKTYSSRPPKGSNVEELTASNDTALRMLEEERMAYAAALRWIVGQSGAEERLEELQGAVWGAPISRGAKEVLYGALLAEQERRKAKENRKN